MKLFERNFKSRKFAFAVLCLFCMTLVFILGEIGMLVHKEIATTIYDLANITLKFLGTITGLMLGVQGMIDHKYGSESQNIETQTKK